jgi:uncharacterized protein (DUF2336 family)
MRISRTANVWAAMLEASKFPNLNGLVELANRDGIDIRPTLLRVMTDLYVQKAQHTQQEQKHFTELALRLIDLVDAKTRAIVANKIAGYPTAPAAVRQRLLKELISIKAPEAPDAVTGPFAGSGTAPADELSELFFAASAEERRLILLNLPYALLPPAQPITPAIARESTHRLEAAALGHNSELFARELERILGISREQARRLYDDESGEPIVVAAVALGMPATVLQRILLCLHPAISQSVQRVYELALLHEEIAPDAALRLVAIWQASHPAEKPSSAPGHRPQYWRDESERNAPALPVARPKVPWDELMQKHRADGA